MTFEELKKEISIWDKWGYSFVNKNIVCYTLHDEYADEKPKNGKIKIDIGYKAKLWISDISLIDFAKLLLDDESRKTFINETGDWMWITEYIDA